MKGSGIWHAEQAWVGHVASDVHPESQHCLDRPAPLGGWHQSGFPQSALLVG